MGAQSWGRRPLTPGPLLARFVPNCANWSVGTAHWAQHTAQAHLYRPKSFGTNSCVLYKLLRTVQAPARSCPSDRPTIG